jgi:pyruvate/2-oxoglutarate dehydrogenase complex dihydrolipoamide dehydrogenase (E3) component
MSPDVDLLVVGGGSAGLTAAVLAAGLGAEVGLVEPDRTGGECLWTGCVPSKALLETAHAAHRMRHADELGLEPADPDVDLGKVLARVRDVQAYIAPHDSPERLAELGVTVHHDRARFTAPRTVRLEEGGVTLRPRAVVLATGSEPALPPAPGLAEAAPLTTDSVWELEELPGRLAVLGGGPVGCELAQAFARLGSEVAVIEMADRLLPAEDPEASALVERCLACEGVMVRTGATLRRANGVPGDIRLSVDGAGGEADVAADRVLAATGRRPRTDGLGLERAGVATGDGGAVTVDRRLRTTAPGVYAAGDVTGELPFTHFAAVQAGTAALNALLWLPRGVELRAVPRVIFTDPEVAHVGLREDEARARWGGDARVARTDYDRVDRAVAAGRTDGFAKLVGDPKGRLVGATVAAPAAGEAIAELAGLIRGGGKIGDVFRTVHPYPTFGLGPATASGEHLRERMLTPRTRRVVRPVLGALRRGRGLRARLG